MRLFKGRRLLSIGLLVSVLVVTGFWLAGSLDHEPRDQGNPLSYWLKEYCRSGQTMAWNRGRQKDVLAAFQAMGTNAIPYVVAEAFNTRQDSAAQTSLHRLFGLLPPPLKPPAFVSAQTLRDRSAFLLKELKPPANLLLPLLEPHWKSTNLLEHAQALFLLGTVGDGAEEAVPWLISALNDGDVNARILAMQSLGWIGPKASRAVPALIALIQPGNTTNSYYRPSVIIALGNIGSNAAPSALLAKDLFDHTTNWNLRCTIAAALLRMDGGQTAALDFLITGMTNHQPAGDRWMAAAKLGEIGPAAQAAVPLMLEVMVGTNSMLRSVVTTALKNLGVPREQIIRQLKQNLRSNDQSTSVNAAAVILDLQPDDKEACSALIAMVQNGSMIATYAIEVLGNAGPPAAAAIPVLRAEAKSNSHRGRQQALEALRRIESKPDGKK